MTEFSKGGIVHGEVNLKVIAAPYPAWKDPNLPQVTGIYRPGVLVLYADECLIGRDKVCQRTDDLHKRFHVRDVDEQGHRRFCPLHDKEDRREDQVETDLHREPPSGEDRSADLDERGDQGSSGRPQG